MDSLTHIAMGVVIGEAVLGREQGRKAWLWGAVLASFPDIDVCFQWFFSPAASMLFHRGITHSIIFCVAMAFLFSYMLKRIYHNPPSYKGWLLLAFCGLFSHIFIDIFNTYSVAIFWPLNTRVVFDCMGIIDVLFLLPLVTAIVAFLFLRKKPQLRRQLSFLTIGLCTFYLGFAAINKLTVEHKVRMALEAEGKQVERVRASPLPITNFIWTVLAEDKSGDGFWQTGYTTTSNSPIRFSYIPRHNELVTEFASDREFERVKRFSRGFYAIAEDETGREYFCDLRFASFDFNGSASPLSAVVKYAMRKDESGHLVLDRASPHREVGKGRLKVYFKQLMGNS